VKYFIDIVHIILLDVINEMILNSNFVIILKTIMMLIKMYRQLKNTNHILYY
jgi:hypothetical protein